MPALNLLRGLKIEGCAFQPVRFVQLAGLVPRRVAVLAFRDFFDQIFPTSQGIVISGEGRETSRRKEQGDNS